MHLQDKGCLILQMLHLKKIKDQFDLIKDEFVEKITSEKGEDYLVEKTSLLNYYFEKLKKEVIRQFVIQENKRIDGRKLDEIRPIWIEVDYLPSTHGSAIFTRGE